MIHKLLNPKKNKKIEDVEFISPTLIAPETLLLEVRAKLTPVVQHLLISFEIGKNGPLSTSVTLKNKSQNEALYDFCKAMFILIEEFKLNKKTYLLLTEDEKNLKFHFKFCEQKVKSEKSNTLLEKLIINQKQFLSSHLHIRFLNTQKFNSEGELIDLNVQILFEK